MLFTVIGLLYTSKHIVVSVAYSAKEREDERESESLPWAGTVRIGKHPDGKTEHEGGDSVTCCASLKQMGLYNGVVFLCCPLTFV